jgi:hypothetical protein
VLLLSRFPLKRLIAAALPITFLWLFAACVSTCAGDSAEHHNPTAVSSSIEISDTSEGEECLITSFPKATAATERATFIPDLKALSAVYANVPSVGSLTVGCTFDPRRLHASLKEPPLERLPSLRI